MNPSIGLAAVLAAAGFCPPAYAQTNAFPSGLCVRTGADAPAGGDADLFDASKETLSVAARERAGKAGLKLDPKACRLLAADGHALTREEVAALAGDKADLTSSSEADAAKRAAAEKQTAAAKLAVANMGAGGAAGTYGDSLRRFDGARAGGDAALAVPGQTAGAAPETGISAVLSAGLQANFKKEAAGRDLLAHFTDADGTVRLPAIVMTDLGGGSVPAQYDRASKTVEMDARDAAKEIVEAAPEGERAALARKLSDPAKLSSYLLAHPEARTALIDGADVTVFHELVHAWQQRRDPAVDAAEGKDPVEWEREAYREELRYFHEKVMRDPALEAKSSDDTLYRELLRGYPGFKTYVTQLYQNSVGSSDFPTVEKLLAKRAQAGRPGAAKGLSNVRQVESDYERREDEFASKTVPAMQAEAFPKLIDRQMSAGHPAEALALAFDAPEEIRAERGPAAFAATRKLLEADPPAPLAERLAGWDAYLAYQTATTKTNLLEPDVFALYQRDRRAAVEQRINEAAKAPNDGERSVAIAWAKSYANELPEKTALLKRIAAIKPRAGASR
jgi:hypothetical protein